MDKNITDKIKDIGEKLQNIIPPVNFDLKPNTSSMSDAMESMIEHQQQKERQSFYRFLIPLIISVIAVLLVGLQFYLEYKKPYTKEKLLQQSGTIQKLSTKIISLEDQIKEIESNLSKTNKTIERRKKSLTSQ